jgi:hypothetical protein
MFLAAPPEIAIEAPAGSVRFPDTVPPVQSNVWFTVSATPEGLVNVPLVCWKAPTIKLLGRLMVLLVSRIAVSIAREFHYPDSN